MTYTKRADLLEAAANSIRMQEAEGVEPVCRVDSGDTLINATVFTSLPQLYEFPLAYVERKPVWVGSELWFTGIPGSPPRKVIIDNYEESSEYPFCCANGDAGRFKKSRLSWNPPTPKPKIPEGFTSWNGGACPVDGDVEVQVLFRDQSLGFIGVLAARIRWHHQNTAGDIIAYRVTNDTIPVSRDKLDKITDLVKQLGEALKD